MPVHINLEITFFDMNVYKSLTYSLKHEEFNSLNIDKGQKEEDEVMTYAESAPSTKKKSSR